MVAFRRGVPVTTTTPTVVVDPGLPAGLHRFELVVTDAAGNVSRPALVSVTIGGLTGPTVPIRPPVIGQPPVRVDVPFREPVVGQIRPRAPRIPRSPR
jgi:hypothetical protein